MKTDADWDASRYHRISDPQFEWGQRVIARLDPAPGERVLDVGCGTGRLTLEIARRAAPARVTGLDRSEAMLSVAPGETPQELRRQVAFVRGDATALPFIGCFDAVFSAATLHWIHEHERVFAGMFGALVPGGRLVAQCGGAGNLAGLLERTQPVMESPEFASHFARWREPWLFADPAATARRLSDAGFVEVATGLEEAPVTFTDRESFAEFVAYVCLRHHLDAIPAAGRVRFLDAVIDQYDEPLILDYQRLNIAARKPSHGTGGAGTPERAAAGGPPRAWE